MNTTDASLQQDTALDNAVSETTDNPMLLQYWNAVLRHKLAIAIIVALAVALGVIATLLTTPYYSSNSRIEINRSQDKVTNVEGLKREDTGENQEFYQTQYALLEARSLAERVARDQNLATNDTFFDYFNKNPDGLLSSEGDGQFSSAESRERRLKLAVDILLDYIEIVPIRGSSLVDIVFSSPNPQFSATIANSWVEQFIASNLDRRFESTADARQFLEQRLAQLRQRLEDSERQLERYAGTKEIVTLSSTQDDDGKTVSRRTLAAADLEALNEALALATADRIATQSEAQQKGGDRNVLNNIALNNIRQQRAEAAGEYAKILTQFEPEYPTAKALASKIEALDASISREEARAKSGTQTRYREALQRERELRSQVDRMKSRFKEERRDSIQYNIFQREVDTNRQLYDGLLQRFKEIGVAGVGSNNISVVDKASPDDEPSSPDLFVNLLVALLGGLGAAAAYVFVSEQIDQSIKDPSDLKSRLGISPLGSVPDLEKQDILAMLDDKKSVAWEAYLSIRTNLSFLTDHGVPRSFLLTSTRPNEGKSTSAYALAAVLGSTGRKILLVDGDMRNPSLHKMIGEDNKSGLSNFLSGTDDLENLMTETGEQGFVAMTAGPIPPNAAELLSSTRMRELVEKLKQRFDTVIIDAPPVLGLADIPLLADAVEGVIFTIEANGVKIRGIESAIQRVRSSRAHIFGAIVTKVATQNAGYGYGYSYQYSYGGKEPA